MAERIPVIRFWLLSRAFIRKAHNTGLKLHAWTVDDPDNMKRAISEWHRCHHHRLPQPVESDIGRTRSINAHHFRARKILTFVCIRSKEHLLTSDYLSFVATLSNSDKH